jgi:hypothetical protein
VRSARHTQQDSRAVQSTPKTSRIKIHIITCLQAEPQQEKTKPSLRSAQQGETISLREERQEALCHHPWVWHLKRCII